MSEKVYLFIFMFYLLIGLRVALINGALNFSVYPTALDK